MNQYNKIGQRHGPWKQYYPNGKLRFHVEYINSQLHGMFEYFDEEGNLTTKGKNKNGESLGLWEYYQVNRIEFYI